MVIVEAVVDVPTIAPIPDDPRRTEQTQCLRHLGAGGVDELGDVVDAQFLDLRERDEDPDPGGISEQPEQLGQIDGFALTER